MGILGSAEFFPEDGKALKLHGVPHEEIYEIKIVKTKPGEIGEGPPFYIAFEGGYMYQGNTLEECLQNIASEWRQDKNICDTDM